MENGKSVVLSMIMAALLSGLVSCQKGTLSRCDAHYGTGETMLVVATGSPGELGLLEKLAQKFLEDNRGTSVCWKKAGTGESLKLLKEGKADVIMVHAPEAEKRAVAEGWAANRRAIGSNEFYIVGPRDDPAGVAKTKTALEAFRRIAAKKAPFISRGDNSGTHKKELLLWRKTGIIPAGAWYIVTGEFMSASLEKAEKLHGYFMTDSSTWVAEKRKRKNLYLLFKGDPILLNRYHVLTARGKRDGNDILAGKFADFLISDKGQRIIRSFGKELYGEAIYNGLEHADTSSRK